MNEFQEINSLRKSGQLQEAYRRAQQALQSSPDDIWIKRAMGWVLYDLIKQELAHISDDEDEQPQVAAVDLRRLHRLFNEFRDLELPRDDCLIYSMMLRLAVKAQKAGWLGFVEFVQWWDLSHLTEEDRQAQQTEDGKEIPSLELMTLYAIGRAATESNEASVHLWARKVLEEAAERHPEDIWIARSLAHLEFSCGDVARAQERLRGVLRRKAREWWLWKEMGELLAPTQPDDAIACYYHACALMRDESKLVGVYQEFASLLASQGRFAEAAWFVERACNIRIQQGWRIPMDLDQMHRAEWFQSHQGAPAPQVDTTAFARRFLQGISAEEVQTTPAVLDHHNSQKQLAYLLITPRDVMPVSYKQFPQVQRLPVGAIVELSYAQKGDSRVVLEVKPAKSQEIEGFVKRVRGRFQKRSNQPFGFIRADSGKQYFVPPEVANALHDDMEVEAVCVLRYNQKREREDWTAVHVDAVQG